MYKSLLLSLIIFLSITFYAFSVVPDVKPEQFTGTWIAKDEVIEKIWVIKAVTSNFGTLTIYDTAGEVEAKFTWEYYTENVYLFNNDHGYFMYYVYFLDKDTRRLRNYKDVTDQFELYKISDSQSGFPQNY